MFRIPRVNVIESDEGFSVEVLGRTGLKYVEGDRVYFVGSELLAASSPHLLAIYSGQILDWETRTKLQLDDLERARIIDKIRRAFRWRGHELDVV